MKRLQGDVVKVWHLAVASWIVTALIAISGINAARTIWYFQEPVVDSVVQPDSYFLAAVCGLLVLALSLLLSCALLLFFHHAPPFSNTHSATQHASTSAASIRTTPTNPRR